MNTTAEKQEVLRTDVFLREILALFFVSEQVFQLARNSREFLDVSFAWSGVTVPLS
jgi:hypothetical protein